MCRGRRRRGELFIRGRVEIEPMEWIETCQEKNKKIGRSKGVMLTKLKKKMHACKTQNYA